MKKTFYVLLIVAAIFAWRDWNRRDITHPPGVLTPAAPRQTNIDPAQTFRFGEFQLTRRAGFQLRARVLSREDYRWGTDADLSPVDLALGWGVMSDQAVLDRIEITQGTRWYFTRYELPAPIPDEAIIRHSSNMHMVPANTKVEKKLKKIRRGDIVNARGFLIDVDHDSGFLWRTSMTREDTGNGSCEIFYVEQFEIEVRGY
jgi:hypothetical protein